MPGSFVIGNFMAFFGGAMSSLVVIKPADTARNSAAISDDPDLVFAAVPAGVYRFQAFWRFLFVTAAGAAGSLHASQALATSYYSIIRARNGATAPSCFAGAGANPSTAADAFQFDIGGVDVGVVSNGMIILPSATDLAFQWAQRAVDAGNPTTLQAGSWMLLERVA